MFNNKIHPTPQEALFKPTYGLYVLSAKENGKDNACIIDSFMQVTNISPILCVITVIKQTLTHDMIFNTKKFNLSVLTKDASYEFYNRFGHQSGRNVNKFDGYEGIILRSVNGLIYLVDNANAYLSFEVKETVDFETHTMFTAELTDCAVLNDKESVSYTYYQQHIKPPKPQTRMGYRCKICEFLYEGDVLPESFLCPICKHGIKDFAQSLC
ncbi:MAG: flavin reductase [Defluviitaleaceae bacterium]|nr:flavin reductase [Defluviitaleaceae bacterium]